MPRKTNKFWKSWKNIRRELKKVIKQNNGEFPTQRRFLEMRVSTILNNMIKYHGGINKVREKMGYKLLRKSKGFWEEWGIYEKEMQKAIKQNNGEFPSQSRLSEMGYSNLVGASRHYGGINKVREKMGYEITKVDDGYYKIERNLEKELKKAIKQNNGEFPVAKRLREMGYNTLVDSIIKHHGGFSAVRKKMGCDEIMKPRGYWKDFSVLKIAIEKIIEENNGEFPSSRKLYKKGYSKINNAIIRHHGGFPAVRERMGYHEAKRQELARKLEKIIMEI